MMYHFTPVRMAIKNLPTIHAWEETERREPSYTVGRNINWYTHCWEQYGSSLQNEQ